MQRFFISPSAVGADGASIAIRNVNTIHQMTRVLRMRVGDSAIFLTNDGREYVSTLTTFSRDVVTAAVREARDCAPEPKPYITVYQSLPRFLDAYEDVLRHGTEVGISRFTPMFSERTEYRSLGLPVMRHMRIIREATEQSERGVMPVLTTAMTFEEVMMRTNIDSREVLYIADSYADTPLLPELLPTMRGQARIGILIGPEGGFSTEEVARAKEAGVQSFSLGKRILRLETAPIAITSAIMYG